MRKILAAILLIGIFTGCSEYQKVLKSANPDLKYEKAVEYFKNEKYNKAYPLFEELLTLYRGTPKAADVYYYYAYTNYYLGDYLLAAYHFQNYYKTFPNTDKSEECQYMVGYCYYLESPVYSLDQSYTIKAINEIQLFVNTHPESERLAKCNELIEELHNKLERKSFEIAKQYYETGYYQAAVVAFNITLNDYPDTKFREDAMYLRLKSAYELAQNSVDSKKLQRYIESQTAYFEFINDFPESPKAQAAIDMYLKIKDQIYNLQQQS